MIFWDIDGVVRDLAVMLWGDEPLYYNQSTIDGTNIMDKLNREPELLGIAPPTEYLPIAQKYQKKYNNIHFITLQKNNDCRHFTIEWIKAYFQEDYSITFVIEESEKMSFIENKFNYLIEDYPFNIRKDVPYFDRIILIDAPYNQHIDCKFRVHNPNELEELLNTIRCKEFSKLNHLKEIKRNE